MGTYWAEHLPDAGRIGFGLLGLIPWMSSLQKSILWKSITQISYSPNVYLPVRLFTHCYVVPPLSYETKFVGNEVGISDVHGV